MRPYLGPGYQAHGQTLTESMKNPAPRLVPRLARASQLLNYSAGGLRNMIVRDFIALDVETANADFASICSVGLVHFRAGEVFKSLTILIDPEDEFDPMNISIHGIRPEDVIGKPTMARVLPVIRAALESVVAVHHSPFDKTALTRAAAKYGVDGLSCAWLDTVRVARRAWPTLAGGGYSLPTIARTFGIEFKHHDAAEDARAAGLIMLRAIADSGLGLEQWLDRVKLTVGGATPGSHARAGNENGVLFGNVVTFTGKLEIPRDLAAQQAASAGCDVSDSVTKRTTILVVGDQDIRRTKGQEKSSKHRRAEELIADGISIRIVGESDFMSMVGTPEKVILQPSQNVEEESTSKGKVRELVITQTPEANRIQELVDRVTSLKRSKEYESALALLNEEMAAQERESRETGVGVAPWYYEHAAIIYRKLNDIKSEIAVLERFAVQRHAPGVGPAQLLARLEKAKSLTA